MTFRCYSVTVVEGRDAKLEIGSGRVKGLKDWGPCVPIGDCFGGTGKEGGTGGERSMDEACLPV